MCNSFSLRPSNRQRKCKKPGMEKADALRKLNALENKLAQIQKQSQSEQQKQLAKAIQDTKTGEPDNQSDAPSQQEMEKLNKDVQEALGNSTKDLQGSKENATSPQPTQMSASKWKR